ncbi:MAG: DUF1152 domain-containing protein [Gemmataceae bacterium]|nr:DUF1152 domain-containing protein [Gemmataceae bacterium]
MPDALTARLLATPFRIPDVAGRDVFVHGLGGGCDVITALAVSTLLDRAAKRIVYGNTKVGGVGPVTPVRPDTPHIVTPASPPPEPGVKPRNCGSAAIDHGVPRDAHGSPFIVRLDDEAAERELVGEVRAVGFDLILGIDAGGDSIASQDGRGRLERDQRMLNVLRRTGVALLHIVVGPGCDGESRVADLRESLDALLAAGRYRGCFRLEPLMPVLRAHSAGLSDARTPRILLAAADGLLARTDDGLVTVPRGCRPVVPAEWLSHAFVFAPEPL